MAKINRNEVIQDDFYGPYIDSLDAVIKKTQEASKQQAKFNEEAAKTAQIVDNSAKGVRDLNAANDKSKSSLEAKQKLDKQIVKLESEKANILKEEKSN